MLFSDNEKKDVYVLVKVPSKGRREGERKGNETTRCVRVSNVNDVFVRLDPQDDFDPSNQEIWAELVKRSEPMDTSEPLESPWVTHPFSFRLDNNRPDPCASFAQIHEHGASFWTNPNHGAPFGRIRIMELPSGNILRASSR